MRGFFFAVAVLIYSQIIQAQIDKHAFGRPPLRQNEFAMLPIGSIQPEGWLKEMLIRQKNGATGHLDELYPSVMGNRNGWKGGDGDQWERGPYWLDGLVPLAYLLKDSTLIAKLKPWIEWTIDSQQPSGYFGPSKDYEAQPGLQRDNSHDWWPKIVMLKVLQQYFDATGDSRVIKLMTNYFKYQLATLPKYPLDHWTFWAKYRAADNLKVIYWLYNKTGEAFLLQLSDLIHQQAFDFTNAFLNTDMLNQPGSIHGVNLSQGMKEPVIYYQQHSENKYRDAFEKGIADLMKFNGMAHGLYGADEDLHGNNPTQGSELCTAVEMMFTLESALPITGDVNYADRLEKIAFNALPAQIDSTQLSRQYFQQANQVMVTRHSRNFHINHHGTDVVYGLLTGFACCTSNMHQGWPKFAQNLWYRTGDNGVAALIYSANTMETTVSDNRSIRIREQTNYPFSESIQFIIEKLDPAGAQFPFKLRIPNWCDTASVTINGKAYKKFKGGQIVSINRKWSRGDVIILHLPMHLFTNRWYERSVSIERGPLVYALKIDEAPAKITGNKDSVQYGSAYEEIRPASPWNFGVDQSDLSDMNKYFSVNTSSILPAYPWTSGNSPIIISARGRRIPNWQLYNEMAGPVPYSMIYNEGIKNEVQERITLIPYGCTRLRISQFPVFPE